MANLKLTEARVTRVARYLSEQFGVIEPARRSRSDRIRSYVARYEAKTTAKNFPFRGASNVHIPLVAEIVDSIKARITNALRAQPDAFVEVQAPIGGDEEIPGLVDPATGRPATWRLIAELFEEYLLFEIGSAGQINMLSALDTFIDDMLMNGTGWLVPIWATDVEMVFPEGAERVWNAFRSGAASTAPDRARSCNALTPEMSKGSMQSA